MLRRRSELSLNDFESGEIGPELFRAGCSMRLERLVSQHKDRPYRAGRLPPLIRVNNRRHPALAGVKEAFG